MMRMLAVILIGAALVWLVFSQPDWLTDAGRSLMRLFE